ncbi:fumarylacetoacetate hydrolase family protein [Streptomyces sp. URMC 125]|uniref:fumarylacetoacetate hydrolase family protein n=1 Tax=Streptomyces sp. URMC 125 TaxID=3423419 RepID=UPI003F1DC68E
MTAPHPCCAPCAGQAGARPCGRHHRRVRPGRRRPGGPLRHGRTARRGRPDRGWTGRRAGPVLVGAARPGRGRHRGPPPPRHRRPRTVADPGPGGQGCSRPRTAEGPGLHAPACDPRSRHRSERAPGGRDRPSRRPNADPATRRDRVDGSAPCRRPPATGIEGTPRTPAVRSPAGGRIHAHVLRRLHTHRAPDRHRRRDPGPGPSRPALRGERRPRRRTSTADLVFGARELIAHTSSVVTLYPGDVIATGTPAGVGPLGHGDRVVVETERIGRPEVGVDGSRATPYDQRPGRRSR